MQKGFRICQACICYWNKRVHHVQETNSDLKKRKFAIFPLFNGPKVLLSASIKAKLFAINISEKSNLDESDTSLLVFSSRTSLKLQNISVTPEMVKKVITNLDSSKASGPDCIQVVVEELWVWTFMHISWTLQHVSKRVLFFRVLEGLSGCPCL